MCALWSSAGKGLTSWLSFVVSKIVFKNTKIYLQKHYQRVKRFGFKFKLKIKRNGWLLARKQQIIALYFEFENELKFYNLEAWSILFAKVISRWERCMLNIKGELRMCV